jgi:hypothetical protein
MVPRWILCIVAYQDHSCFHDNEPQKQARMLEAYRDIEELLKLLSLANAPVASSPYRG